MPREPVMADTRGLDQLARRLREVAPAGYTATRKGLRIAGVAVLERAKANASYSARIPASGRVVVSHGLVVRVVFGGQGAPNAAAIENEGRGSVRHPTYSPRPASPEKVGWTAKHSRPAFLRPALHEEGEATVATVSRLVDQAVNDVLGRL